MFIRIIAIFLMKSDFDIYDPRYTRVKSSDWEAFRDPKKFWYTPMLIIEGKWQKKLKMDSLMPINLV